jgi:hypothetical protein
MPFTVMVPVAELASEQPAPNVTVTTWPTTTPEVVPEQPAKLPPRTTVAGLEGIVKAVGKVTATVSPGVSVPVEVTVKCAVQLAPVACATLLVLVKLTAVTEPPGAVMAVVAVTVVVFSEVATE